MSETAVTPTKVISPPPQQGNTFMHCLSNICVVLFSDSLRDVFHSIDLPKKKKNSGFLSLFRRGKKKSEMVCHVGALWNTFTQMLVLLNRICLSPKCPLSSSQEVAVSAPVSPGHSQQVRAGRNGQVVSSSYTLQAEMPKKRPAPQPPMGASHSVPNNLSTCHLKGQVG